ncbi:hypothetical protein [Methylobacterium oxalidis]|uniref:hypothetical protein n=1 Tax=Methylobacterium oxalidis TaxID=944322 RepID=UPI00331488D7
MTEAADWLDVLTRLVKEGEAAQSDRMALIEYQTRLGQDTTVAEAALREIKDALATMRAQRLALQAEGRDA